MYAFMTLPPLVLVAANNVLFSSVLFHVCNEQGKSVPCINPATGEKIGEVKAYTNDEVDEVVSRARKAQQAWAKTSFEERSAVLRDVRVTTVRTLMTDLNLSFEQWTCCAPPSCSKPYSRTKTRYVDTPFRTAAKRVYSYIHMWSETVVAFECCLSFAFLCCLLTLQLFPLAFPLFLLSFLLFLNNSPRGEVW